MSVNGDKHQTGKDQAGSNKGDVFLNTMAGSVSAVEKYRAPILVVLAVLLISGIAYAVVEQMDKRAERAAAEDLYKVEMEYETLRTEYDRAKLETLQPTPGEKPESSSARPATGDLAQDYGTVIAGLEKVVKAHPKTAAGAQASIMLGELYVDYKQPEKAVAALDQVSGHLKSDEFLFGLVHILRGSAQAAQGDCEKAVGSWQTVISAEKSSYLHPDALLKSGVCFETLKKNDQAAQAYRRVTEEFAESSAAQSARALLRALEAQNAGAQAAPATSTAG